MPKKDTTGPQGMGPMTGRGFGPCGEGFERGQRAAGRGKGFGWRRFWGCYCAPNLSGEEEKEILVQEEKVLEEELKSVKERLNQMEGDK